MQVTPHSTIDLSKLLAATDGASESLDPSQNKANLDFATVLLSQGGEQDHSDQQVAETKAKLDDLVRIDGKKRGKNEASMNEPSSTHHGNKQTVPSLDAVLSGQQESQQTSLQMKLNASAPAEVLVSAQERPLLSKISTPHKTSKSSQLMKNTPVSEAIVKGDHKQTRLADLLKVGNKQMGEVNAAEVKSNQLLSPNGIQREGKDANLTLLEFGQNLNKGNKSDVIHYQKKIKSLDNNLVKAPIHQEIVEDIKPMNAKDEGSNFQNFQDQAPELFSLEQKVADHELSPLHTKSLKTLDLSHIKADSKSALIKEVANYIEQSYVSNRGSVDLLVKHEELGDFRVYAQKTGVGQQVQLEISTASTDAHQFFAKNESELMRTLQDNGVKLSQMKIVSKSESAMIGDMRQGQLDQFSQDHRGENRHDHRHDHRGFSQRQSSQGEDTDRRRQLWQNAQAFRDQQFAA